MLRTLMAESGYFSAAEVFRVALRNLYLDEFKVLPDHRGRKKKPISQDDHEAQLHTAANQKKYCEEVLKGEVVEIDGQMYCVVGNQTEGISEYLPMRKDV